MNRIYSKQIQSLLTRLNLRPAVALTLLTLITTAPADSLFASPVRDCAQVFSSSTSNFNGNQNLTFTVHQEQDSLLLQYSDGQTQRVNLGISSQRQIELALRAFREISQMAQHISVPRLSMIEGRDPVADSREGLLGSWRRNARYWSSLPDDQLIHAIRHEVGHLVLGRYLDAHSNIYRRVRTDFFSSYRLESWAAGRDGTGVNLANPSQQRMTRASRALERHQSRLSVSRRAWWTLLAYEELFADYTAALFDGHPHRSIHSTREIIRADNMLGSTEYDFELRRFDLPADSQSMAHWQSGIRPYSENERPRVYQYFWPLRQELWNLSEAAIARGVSKETVYATVAQTILEDINSQSVTQLGQALESDTLVRTLQRRLEQRITQLAAIDNN